MMRACRLGDPGYVVFLKALYRLGVLDHDELLVWLNVHGLLLRATEEQIDDDVLAEMASELGGNE